MHAANLLKQIQKCNLVFCIAEMRNWLVEATPGDLANLLDGCTEFERLRIVVLLRDILTYHPKKLFGAPVLLDWRSPTRDQALLPFATNSNPNSSFTLKGWLPADASVLGSKPRTDLSADTNTVTTAIAVFEVDADIEDVKADDIDNMWWGELFNQALTDDNVYLSSRMLLPLPDAIEAAFCMHSTATRRSAVVEPTYFINKAVKAWALQAGQAFRDDWATRPSSAPLSK